MSTELSLCPRCGATAGRDVCWWCGALLCDRCWEDLGHCGHPEADAINRRSAETDFDGRRELVLRALGDRKPS